MQKLTKNQNSEPLNVLKQRILRLYIRLIWFHVKSVNFFFKMNLSQGGRSTSWYHDDPNPFGITQQHTVSKLKKVQKMMNWKLHNGMEYSV